ncbi:MAG: threonine ammonia-lyase IlvA [Rubellimicrobium sp.]|nr:threonine ammonia-lyase IlvA [Rubellimicrobium sp.]
MSDFIKNVRATADALRELFPATPLQRNDFLSARYGADILLKREDLAPVRSYKLRGAFNAMRRALAAHPEQRAFVCASAGNHAQGVAYACRHFGVRGTIFMPVTTPHQKIDKTRSFGGGQVEIVLTGDYLDQSLAAARTFCTEAGAHFLSPFDDPDVIEGQATVAVEILDQLGRAPDLVILPVGGGGLGAGVVSVMREAAPATQFLFVEPSGGASLAAALAARHPVTLERVNSFIDGAAVGRTGDLPFSILRDTDPARVLLVPEDRVCGTMLELLNVEGIVLEPAGALSVDVLGHLAEAITGRTVVCITSGGNFDFERLPEVKERAQRFAGLKKYFILRMPQRPGALRDFLGLLGPEDDIARFEYLKKTARNFGSVLIGIETTDPANFPALFARMDAAELDYRDITEDAALAEFLI